MTNRFGDGILATLATQRPITLSYDCPNCADGVESLGTDASSRLAVAVWKAAHVCRVTA